MRIGVNLHHLTPGEIGGMEIYARSILEWIPVLDRSVELVLFCPDRNVATFAARPGIEIHHLSEQEFVDLDADRLAAAHLDVWFCPLLTMQPETPRLRTIVTVPDLQHERHPEFFTDEVLEWRRQQYVRTVWEADRLLTLSAHARSDLVEFFGIPEEKIVVTHLDAQPSVTGRSAGDVRDLDRVRREFRLPERYLYYPANDWPHKNHRVLFDALARFRDRGVEPPLLVLSGAHVEPETDWTAELERRGLTKDVRHVGFVPADRLRALYELAEAMVFPSLFEGFGMPVVEAMRSGCPVVCSNATSLPEVTGDAVLAFDPLDADALFDHLWALHVDRVEGTGELRRSLVAAGRDRARRFGWQRTAETTLEAIYETAGRRRPLVVRDRVDDDERDLPSITIVTPSFNHGPFLERTIRSVLEQDHEAVDHLVIDGGSTDDSLTTLRTYASRHDDRFDFISEPDRGQAHAVNKGFRRATGDVIGWLNSDDVLAPGALSVAARAFAEHPDWEVVYGDAIWISEDDAPIAPYPTDPAIGLAALEHDCGLCQPAVFLRRSLIDRGIELDEQLQWCMDYDLWVRLARQTEFHFIDRPLAHSRLHADTKTLGSRTAVYDEIIATARRHFGRVSPTWILGRAHHQASGGRSFLDPPVLDAAIHRRAVVDLVRENWRAPRFVLGEMRVGAGRSWLAAAARQRTTASAG